MSDLITIAALIMVSITLILVGIAPILASRYVEEQDEPCASRSQRSS